MKKPETIWKKLVQGTNTLSNSGKTWQKVVVVWLVTRHTQSRCSPGTPAARPACQVGKWKLPQLYKENYVHALGRSNPIIYFPEMVLDHKIQVRKCLGNRESAAWVFSFLHCSVVSVISLSSALRITTDIFYSKWSWDNNSWAWGRSLCLTSSILLSPGAWTINRCLKRKDSTTCLNTANWHFQTQCQKCQQRINVTR